MPSSSLRWRGRPLRLTVSCSAAARAVRAPSSATRYYTLYYHGSHSSHSTRKYSCVSAASAANHTIRLAHYHCNTFNYSQHRHHFSQALRPPQPHPPQPSPSQRRVYQTSSATSIPVILPSTATSLSLPSLGSRPPRTPSDLPTASSLQLYSTSSRPSSSFSSSSSSSSARLAPFTPSFSRKQRRKFARWLPALMATQVRSHSDDSSAKDAKDTKNNSNGNGDHDDHAHSHGLFGHHHHSHDNAYLTSQNKNDAGVRITRIGLYSNLGMALAKGAGGYFFNSQSMVADAWHSLTDLASDFLTLATVSWSLRPPTDKFPTGFGKVESLGSLGVSGMLLGGGIFMCMSSLQILHAHFFLDAAAAAEVMAHGHGHSHSHAHGGLDGPSLHAAWLALGTVLIKEWLYRATMKVALERKSSVLASNAVHHRVDSMTGIVTLFAILGANFIHDASWLDPVGGLFISLLVIRAGWENTASALYELADRSIDDDIKRSVRKSVAKALSNDVLLADGQQHLAELREVSGVKSGQNYLVDLELAVPGDWTVENVRVVEDAVRTQVGNSVRGVRRVHVRFVKLDESVEKFDEFISGDVSPRSSPEPDEHDHNHDHNHGHGGKEHKH
ncbi:mitochondrial metal transporter [Sporothrix curviconia]|uniref:Mitochondrial metal transporter n=1 Tax=Sporothrix curviconia TaxID=1260050 RepID=A0ABP0B7Z5_9PEZI